jgi:hypothetical protein
VKNGQKQCGAGTKWAQKKGAHVGTVISVLKGRQTGDGEKFPSLLVGKNGTL